MARRPNHRGRVTPKSDTTRPPSSSEGATPPHVAGRRPSNPGFLLLVGLMWIACGIIALVGLSASWKLIPGIVFIGIGVLFLRGAATTSARRDR